MNFVHFPKRRLEAVVTVAFTILMLLFAADSWFSHLTSRALLDD
jgi:hypothetical protein